MKCSRSGWLRRWKPKVMVSDASIAGAKWATNSFPDAIRIERWKATSAWIETLDLASAPSMSCRALSIAHLPAQHVLIEAVPGAAGPHHRAAARRGFEEPLAGQKLDRLTHGGARNRHLAGQKGGIGKRGAGAKLAGNDPPAELLGHQHM